MFWVLAPKWVIFKTRQLEDKEHFLQTMSFKASLQSVQQTLACWTDWSEALTVQQARVGKQTQLRLK